MSQNAVFPGKYHDNKILKFCEFYCQIFCCHLGGSYSEMPFPKDPPVLKILRRVNSVQAVQFGTEMRKRYRDCSEMLVSQGKGAEKRFVG